MEKDRFNQIVNFLSTVHPFLKGKNREGVCIELRTKARNEDDYKFSTNIWNLNSEKSLEHLEKWLDEAFNLNVCVYFSLYSMIKKKFVDEEGKPLRDKKGKIMHPVYIRKLNAQYTQILSCDLDDCTEETLLEILAQFKELGLNPYAVFSGHGYQLHFLLNNPLWDLGGLRRFMLLLRKKGIPCDRAFSNPGRVGRLEGSFNKKDFENPIETFCYQMNDNRYEAETVFKLIETLPDKPLDEVKLKRERKTYRRKENALNSPVEPLKEEKESQELSIKKAVAQATAEPANYYTDEAFEKAKEEYSMISFDGLQLPLKKALIYTPEGIRNTTLIVLTNIFKAQGISLKTIESIISVWANHCNYDQDFKSQVPRYFYYTEKTKKYWDVDMAKAFGYMEFKSIYERQQSVNIPQSFFEEKVYAQLSMKAIQIYLLMRAAESFNSLTEWTQESIIETTKISESTFHRNFKELLKAGYVDKKEVKGKKTRYYINVFKILANKGFIPFERSFLENMYQNKFKALTGNEAKVYLLLVSKCNGGKKCEASQETLSRMTGLSQSRISEITDSLFKKKYIEKKTLGNVKKYCEYILRY